MMGRQSADQGQFFYERVPETHLLRRIDLFVKQALANVHREVAAFYRSRAASADADRWLLLWHPFRTQAVRRSLAELAYRWFCTGQRIDHGYRCPCPNEDIADAKPQVIVTLTR